MTGNDTQGDCPTSENFNWSGYHQATHGNPPRPLLAQAVQMLESAGDALELGAGAGNEVRYLLDQGFRVTAVDADAGGIDMLRAIGHPNLQVVQSTYDSFAFDPDTYDLVSAQYALPFNPAATFDAMFARLRRSIRPGGLFSGNLFGDRDEWNTPGSGKTFLRREEAIRLFDGFDLLHFDENEEERGLAQGGTKHWHVFDIIARRPVPVVE
jgi:tellurite methyltransferase